jgi:feruloyl esterase
MILSLLAWTENGTAPEYIIGASYNNGNKASGVQFERPLCPYPLVGIELALVSISFLFSLV